MSQLVDSDDECQGAGVGATTSDADLIAASLGGDRNAFETLLRRHYDRIYRLAWRVTGAQADAEDVAQDICCALVEKLGSFRGQSRFTTWLVGITLNACRDHLRRRTTLKRFRDGLSVLTSLTGGPDGRDLYLRSAMAGELARLHPALRETVMLVAGEDLSHAEAAQVLGVAESTVSWRMHEARRRLSLPADGKQEQER